MIKAIFKGLCPNCKGDISSDRLEKGLPCERCLPNETDPEYLIKGALTDFLSLREEERQWVEHFTKYMKSPPWSLQIAWARRVFLGRSFALLAPTGVGKTSFGVSMSSYLAKKGKKTYIIVPTRLLVEQITEKLLLFGVEKKTILAFGDEGSDRREKKLQLKEGFFNVLITTSMFLYKNYDIIPRFFDFIFIDDVDSFLKTAKNIDKVLLLLGFSEESIEKALNLIKLRSKRYKEEHDRSQIEYFLKELKELRQKNRVLVVSSATSTPKSDRVRLFKELLGFEVGAPMFYLRNVVDVYTKSNLPLYEWIKELGQGGLVFVPSDVGREKIAEIIKELQTQGISAISYEDVSESTLRKFENGQIDVIIGIASYRNPLARGLDLPHAIRYALFWGVPKIVISLKFETNISHLLWALSSLRSAITKNLPQYITKVDRWISQLRHLQHFSEDFLSTKPWLNDKAKRLREEIHSFLNSDIFINLMSSSNEVTLRRLQDGYYMVISDATGYLQASGRTSRMFAGGVTKGLSLLIVDDERAFTHLQKKLRWFSEEIKFKELGEIDLSQILREIDEDREKIKKIKLGEISSGHKEILKPVLIIVESPNKARTIANFFGKAIRRKIGEQEVLETSVEDKYLMITSSFGHILDLCTEGGFYGVKVNEEVVPIYEPIDNRESIIQSLRLISEEVFEVLIATDPDTEGEKIGWDILMLLMPFVNKIRRMEFHEVTKKAIINSLKNPRDFHESLVKAQILRRVADRWIGFEFSRLLWKEFGTNILSAGRVQTPVLGWIIAKEAEYRKRIYKVIVRIGVNRKPLRVEFVFEEKDKAKQFFENLKEVEVTINTVIEEERHPPPPLRTDTLLKEANDKLRFSVPLTMQLAQILFELGFITYHRTDSIRVSDYGISLAKEYVKEEFAEEYFAGRSWSQEGAHECIRPTKPLDGNELRALVLSGQIEGLSRDHVLLYDLIFKRFIASQMRPIKVKEAEICIKALGEEKNLRVCTDILTDGWNRMVSFDTYNIQEGIINVENNKEFRSEPKAFLYTQGELVQEMREKGIGRPSTYATIVEKLLERHYVIEKKGRLIPTKLGKKVYQYLLQYEKVRNFLSENFTKHLEKLMDEVEEGKGDYEYILKQLYTQICNIT